MHVDESSLAFRTPAVAEYIACVIWAFVPECSCILELLANKGAKHETYSLSKALKPCQADQIWWGWYQEY